MTQRGIDMSKQKVWIDAIEKENFLRLKWFRRNEVRLNEIANKESQRTVSDQIKEEHKQGILARFKNVDRKGRRHIPDAPPPDIDLSAAIKSLMRPVDPGTLDLLYKSTMNNGRVSYLKARKKIIPEVRYYFQECSSFEYGWKMWHASKAMKRYGFGKKKIVQDSFYRKQGAGRDPDWYREPSKISPSVCGCL